MDLEGCARAIEPRLIRRDGDVLRTLGAFLSLDDRSQLIEARVVEAGRKQAFYIKIASHAAGGASVRIDPQTRPERSAGVRDLVANVRADLLRRSPRTRLGATNLVVPSAARSQRGGTER